MCMYLIKSALDLIDLWIFLQFIAYFFFFGLFFAYLYVVLLLLCVIT